MVGIRSGKSPLKFLQCDSAGWWPLAGLVPTTGLPWNLSAMPGICTGPPQTLDGTSSQAHQLVMSLTLNTHRPTLLLVYGHVLTSTTVFSSFVFHDCICVHIHEHA